MADNTYSDDCDVDNEYQTQELFNRNDQEKEQVNDKEIYDVQRALNNARNYRDQNLTAKRVERAERAERLPERSERNAKSKQKRPQVFYNPSQNDDDLQSNYSVAPSVAGAAGEYRDSQGKAMQLIAIPANTKFQAYNSQEDDDTYNFKELSYEDIQINLRLLGDIVQDEKLHISANGKKMQVDERTFQPLRRYMCDDSRDKTLEFIKHVYHETERLCEEIVDLVERNEKPKENTEKLINLYGLIGSSGRGLDRLNMTYSDDKLFAAKISTIKKDFETYCDRTLKGTIEGFKKNLE